MESLAGAAAKVSEVLRNRRTDVYGHRHNKDQMESYRSVYTVVDSVLNDLSDSVSDLPAELMELRTESERLLRRYQLHQSEDEDEFRGALAWLHFFGNATDLAVLNAVRSSVSLTYPDSVLRIDGTVAAISSRLQSVPRRKKAFTRAGFVGVTACIVCSVALVSLSAHGFSQYQVILTLGVAAGLSSALFLLNEGFMKSRGAFMRVCYIAAGILMFVETAGLLKRVGSAQ